MKYLIIIILCLLTGCKNTTNPNFSIEVQTDEFSDIELAVVSQHFKFTHPQDWQVTEDELLEEGVHYMAVEKNGFTSTGMVIITAFEQTLDLDEVIMVNFGELENNNLLKKLTVGQITDDYFNKNKSRSSNFHFNSVDSDYEGVIHAFHDGDITYAIMIQGALKDREVNQNGIQQIESSFESR